MEAPTKDRASSFYLSASQAVPSCRFTLSSSAVTKEQVSDTSVKSLLQKVQSRQTLSRIVTVYFSTSEITQHEIYK